MNRLSLQVCCLSRRKRFLMAASQVKTIDGRGINYLAAIPLLHREMLFARHEGSEELVERLFEAGVNELLQPDRQSVV